MAILIVLGVRPHAAKAACLQAAAGQQKDANILYYLTYQQDNFLELALSDQELKSIKRKSICFSDFFPYQAIIDDIKKIVNEFGINVILSVGDTKTSLVAALGALKSNRKLVHYESGLRSEAKNTIEEMIRRKIDAISDFHLVYNEWCANNLKLEGVSSSKIKIVGSLYEESLARNLKGPISSNGYVVVCLHRKENFRSSLIFDRVFDQIKTLNMRVIFIQHPSNDLGKTNKYPHVTILKTQTVASFIDTIRGASLIITDSGGICEQATLLRKPVLVLRPAIERPWLVGGRTLLTSISTLAADLRTVLRLKSEPFNRSTLAVNVSDKIVDRLVEIDNGN